MKDNLNRIREIDFYDIKIGGETSFPILNPLYVLNVPAFDSDDNFEIVKSYFGTDCVERILKSADNSDCDIVGLKFNIKDIKDINYVTENLKSLLSNIKKPVMISGAGNDDTDKILLPEIMKHLDRKVIINGANENTYKDIVFNSCWYFCNVFFLLCWMWMQKNSQISRLHARRFWKYSSCKNSNSK